MAEKKVFEATPEAKALAKQLRLFAFLAWITAIAGEVFAIVKLIHDETMTWLIVTIVVILALAVTGSLLWKRANKMDPASMQNKFKFFVQSQLGVIMSVLAFLPLAVLIFTNKEISGKTKGIAGVVAVVALLAASIAGIDFNPPSVEKYTEEINAQTDIIKNLNNGTDLVYWTPTGKKYHLFQDCYTIKNSDVSSGTVEEAWKAHNKEGVQESEFCLICKRRAEKRLESGSDNPLLNEPASESEKESEAAAQDQ